MYRGRCKAVPRDRPSEIEKERAVIMAKPAGTTYQELDRILVADHTKTIGNNTTAHRGDDGVIYVYLHGHNIVDLHPDGTVCLRDCGYQTVTTKDRLNQFCPLPYRIGGKKYVWEIQHIGYQATLWPGGRRGVMFFTDGGLAYSGERVA